MLTPQELDKIFSWLPYRGDWPIGRNKKEDNVDKYYGKLIVELTQNQHFETYSSEKGGLSNYLEFFCYPFGHQIYRGSAIMVCISLCAPIAAYGQVKVGKTNETFVWNGLFSPDDIGFITDGQLFEIEKEIERLLLNHNLNLIDKEFACRILPTEIVKSSNYENHNEGEQYLHGIFQKTD
jgi:hypothetical protein